VFKKITELNFWNTLVGTTQQRVSAKSTHFSIHIFTRVRPKANLCVDEEFWDDHNNIWTAKKPPESGLWSSRAAQTIGIASLLHGGDSSMLQEPILYSMYHFYGNIN
jgi:hypothetical protein